MQVKALQWKGCDVDDSILAEIKDGTDLTAVCPDEHNPVLPEYV